MASENKRYWEKCFGGQYIVKRAVEQESPFVKRPNQAKDREQKVMQGKAKLPPHSEIKGRPPTVPLEITETETESVISHMHPKLDVWGKGKVIFF